MPVVPVEFLSEAHINYLSLLGTSARKCLSSLLSQMLLKKDSISRVAFVYSICKVSYKWDKADEEVNGDIQSHPKSERGWEATINLLTSSKNEQCKQCISTIPDTGRIVTRRQFREVFDSAPPLTKVSRQSHYPSRILFRTN